jgi:hypothetical protein
MRYASYELLNYWQEHPRPTAASMSGSYRVRREAHARSNLGRQQATRRLSNGREVTVTVVRRRKAA